MEVEQKKLKIKKLKINTLSYIFQFLTEEEIFRSIAKCSKYFFKALNRESLFENLVLRSDLFTSNDKTSWREKFLGYKKLMKSFKSGKANTSFKMYPCRGHKQVITSICLAKVDVNWKLNKFNYNDDENEEIYDENVKQKFDNWLITGDSLGVINHWIFDKEEKEFIPYTIYTPDNKVESNEIRYINFHEAKSKIYQFEENKNFLIVVFKSGKVNIYNIVPHSQKSDSDKNLNHNNSRIILSKSINTSIIEPVQFIIKNGLLFLSTNLHTYGYIKLIQNAVESIDLYNDNEPSFQTYSPSCKLKLFF